MNEVQTIFNGVKAGNFKAIARALSWVENGTLAGLELLKSLPANSDTKVVGVTGPPGAGKSTLVDALIEEWVNREKKVAVLCVDPSSPFNLGSLLGDRIRMSHWYTNENVFIRSLASRGSLGGLHPRIIELTEVLQTAPFDVILVETVGVGQSEVEITGLADITLVTLVPEAGDEVQTMKAGLMEIADVFVVNKADRPDADRYANNLKMLSRKKEGGEENHIPVVSTVATQRQGIHELWEVILKELQLADNTSRRSWLLTQRAWHLIREYRMRDLDAASIRKEIEQALLEKRFNLYRFVEHYQ